MPADLPSAVDDQGADLGVQLAVPDVELLKVRAGRESVPLIVSRGRRRSIGVHIYPDRPAELRLPKRYQVSDVTRFLLERMDWIERTVQALPHGVVHPQQYHDGAMMDVFGVQRRLTLLWGRLAVELRDDQLLVYGRDHDPDAVEKQLSRYLSKLASEYLPERLAYCHRIASERLGERLPSHTVSVRKMKAAWGRCRESGHISLNATLVQKSPDVIDLVLIHELCHLRVMDHGPRFQALMDVALPDWPRREVLLAGRF